MTARSHPVHGAGLGLRRAFMAAAAEQPPPEVSFWEIAPENWIGVGGRWGRRRRSTSNSWNASRPSSTSTRSAPTPST